MGDLPLVEVTEKVHCVGVQDLQADVLDAVLAEYLADDHLGVEVSRDLGEAEGDRGLQPAARLVKVRMPTAPRSWGSP